MYNSRMNRRGFLKNAIGTGAVIQAGCILPPQRAFAVPLPKADPVAHLNIGWTRKIKWDHVLDISKVDGPDWHVRLDKAQKSLAVQGGGVVYFPAGTYSFKDSIHIMDGVVLRGAEPEGATDAHDKTYALGTRFEFPKYEPSFTGDGSPIDTAFKGIYLEDVARASNCGMVNIFVNRGHIHLGQAQGFKAGSNRIIFGCVMKNAAIAEENVPDLSIGQHPWQRFTKWHWAAVSVKVYENALLANNRFIESDDSFLVRGYVLQARRKEEGTKAYDVWFDYDFRPGLECNDCCMGAPGGEEPSGTPETHPWGFRKGIVIRDNYLYSTGRNAIMFSGDGTLCANNVIRFKKDVWRQTVKGFKESSGSSTTDTRAVQMRGWRWTVENNDYEVHRNWASDHAYHINDGEGLMHENHCNSAIKDSKLLNNRGNAYLSLYKTGLIDGLIVEGNDIRVDRGMAIFVDADHDKERTGPCRNVRIVNNTTVGGILIAGTPASNNVVRGNKNVGPTAPIDNRADAVLEDNTGYELKAKA